MSLVLVEKPRPHVGLVTLNQPDRLNSMSFGLVETLYRALAQVADDNDIYAVVLTGAGRGFSSGLDLHDRGVPPNTHDLGFARLAMRSMSYMGGIVPAMQDIPQPIIAAVNGCAVGGGLCLTLGCDIRYAATSAYFSAAGIINGLSGSELGISYLLPRAVGSSHASEILLTGRRVAAAEAFAMGLVSRVVPDGEVLDEALDTAAAMCELSVFGVQMTKRTLWANVEVGSLGAAIDLENRNQLLAGYTGNLDEAIAAWREKRKPVYPE